MHSFDLMKLQMKQLVVAELDTFCFNGAVTYNTSMYILCNTIQVLHRAMNLVERIMVCCSISLSTAVEEHSQDDSLSLFNNAAAREYTPICLGSLFALYMLQTIEPAP